MAEQAGFERCVSHLTEAPLARLATELSGIGLLGTGERRALQDATTTAVDDAVSRKLTRLLLVELHAARVSGSLHAPDSASRWDEFVESASQASFWESAYGNYPTLRTRLDALIARRCAATLELARRLAADRQLLASIVSGPPDIVGVEFGRGDSHRGGRTVAMVHTGGGTVVYKPRSLDVDRSLARLLDELFEPTAPQHRIRVPRVVRRQGYGWAEYIEHSYCSSEGELSDYYTGLGHWLAVAKLVGASDLHAENLIAHGRTPVVIDCETLFRVATPQPASGYGQAVDTAATMLAATLLQSGLLPGRASALGWRGADVSAAGALPSEQPPVQVACLVGGGTDLARLGLTVAEPPRPTNRPSPEPALGRHWHRVLAGFDELTARMAELDRSGNLAGLLRPFAQVETRAVLRATESYAELARMLWHPVSLHDEPAAVCRAENLLVRQGETNPPAPTDPAVVAAEIADLLVGDIPFFEFWPGGGRLHGPGGAVWGDEVDLVALTLARWRAADLTLEREVIRSTLVSVYLNEGSSALETTLPVEIAVPTMPGDRDDRRRRLAADLVKRVIDSAIIGEDGTATWIAPSLSATGWSVHPIGTDLYAGASGIALMLASYQREVTAGRAWAVEGVESLLQQVLHGLGLAEMVRARGAARGFRTRPLPPGLYVGLGSQIHTWLALRELGAVDDEGLLRASELGQLLPASLDEPTEPDLLIGTAGAIVALLRLADATGENQWLGLAESVAEGLISRGHREDGTLSWRSPRSPDGLGGFAHGATGIGWALARLSAVSGRPQFTAAADAAFAFEETLWSPQAGGWRDARGLDGAQAPTGWCHGSTGIGLASLDLAARGVGGQTDHYSVARRAAEAGWQNIANHGHSLCHGDLARWELLTQACEAGLAPAGTRAGALSDPVLASLEQHGPITGAGPDVFSPGLLPGLAGLAYQLLRMQPDCDLPSVLLPG